MNLTFHIIKKDLRRMAWALAVWGICGLYLLFSSKYNIRELSVWDSLKILAVVTSFILSFVLIAAIVQEDGLTESDVFWRTRPTSGQRMLAAKLILLATLFVVLPLVLIFVSRYADLGKMTLSSKDAGYIVLVVMSLVLSAAAVAACTKDLVRYIMIGALCLVASALLSAFLERFATPLPFKARNMVGLSRGVAIMILCLVTSGAVLANQYLGRNKRLEISQLMIAGAVVGIALINTFWAWDFLPR